MPGQDEDCEKGGVQIRARTHERRDSGEPQEKGREAKASFILPTSKVVCRHPEKRKKRQTKRKRDQAALYSSSLPCVVLEPKYQRGDSS